MNRAINYFALAVLTLPGMASAQFNIDVANPNNGDLTPTSAYGAAANQPGFWNYGFGSGKFLRSLDGALTSTTFGIPGAGSAHLNIASLTGDEKRMMETGSGTTASDTPGFGNLTLGVYDLYVYMWEPFGGGGNMTVTCDVSNGLTHVLGSVTHNSTWPGQQMEGVTYAKIRVESVPTKQFLSMQFSWFGGQPADTTVVNGLQLVPVPAPAPGAAALLATAGLMFRRRNRRMPSMSRVPLPTKALRSR